MTRGRRCPTRHKANCRKCLAATQSRLGESMKSIVLPSESSGSIFCFPFAPAPLHQLRPWLSVQHPDQVLPVVAGALFCFVQQPTPIPLPGSPVLLPNLRQVLLTCVHVHDCPYKKIKCIEKKETR